MKLQHKSRYKKYLSWCVNISYNAASCIITTILFYYHRACNNTYENVMERKTHSFVHTPCVYTTQQQYNGNSCRFKCIFITLRTKTKIKIKIKLLARCRIFRSGFCNSKTTIFLQNCNVCLCDDDDVLWPSLTVCSVCKYAD